MDGSRITGKAELMRALNNALAFPAHVGGNWDALLDMLRDLSWLPAKGYVLVIGGLKPLARTNAADYQMALDVLWDAAQFWRERRAERTLIILVS
ncbi:MAG: barstar family protein [Anaerolineae bacterium]|nr:barstar family protein [Anaerolineae bacterium]